MPIPTIQPPRQVNSEELSQLIECGIAYVPIPENLAKKLELIEKTGNTYFQQPQDRKRQYLFTPETREGFFDQTAIGYDIERYIIRTSLPSDPAWNACCTEMLEVRKYIRHEIFEPLLVALFGHLEIDPEKIKSYFKAADSTLSILYYPPRDTSSAERRLRPHEDAALMTTVWTQDPGLEVNIEGKWHSASAKKGHITLNLGHGLNLMLDNKCHAVKHRVLLPNNQSKLSLVSFYTPDPAGKFINAVSGKKIADTFGEYATNYLEKNFPKLTTVAKLQAAK